MGLSLQPVLTGPQQAQIELHKVDGVLFGARIIVVCPVPAIEDLQAQLPGHTDSVPLQLTVIHGTAEEGVSLPFAGVAGGNVVTIASISHPPPSPPPPPPPPPPSPPPPDTDWVQRSFSTDGSRGCSGTMYVKKDKMYGYYVAVTECSSGTGRFKVYLGQTSTGTFYSIGDGGGSGQDQCDFVGSTSDNGSVGPSTPDTSKLCYSRTTFGSAPASFGSCPSNHWIPEYTYCPQYTCCG